MFILWFYPKSCQWCITDHRMSFVFMLCLCVRVRGSGCWGWRERKILVCGTETAAVSGQSSADPGQGETSVRLLQLQWRSIPLDTDLIRENHGSFVILSICARFCWGIFGLIIIRLNTTNQMILKEQFTKNRNSIAFKLIKVSCPQNICGASQQTSRESKTTQKLKN